MKLYLVQHGKAVQEEVDPQRPLTEQGRRETAKVAEFIKPLKISVDYLWHSGKKRAAQTAEIMSEVVKYKTLTAHNGLGPNDDVTILKDELATAQQDIMIVGHLPFLCKLTSLLLAGSESANILAFKNSGIVCLTRYEKDQWQLDWVVIPELLV